ncbi:hemerythrin domain-containing protein [Heyndrickxia coagulans]
MEMLHCAMVGGASDVALCAGLNQLKNEHGHLNERKRALYETAGQIINGELENKREALDALRKGTESFSAQLKHHAEREENVLFTMMARYIGRENGPIAMMEYEHDEAEKYIEIFLNGTKIMDEDQAEVLASYIVQMYELLTNHFFKEENVLFPMAENLLSAAEKDELEEKVCTTGLQ